VIFVQTPPTEAYDAGRWVSESGRWEFGARRTTSGVRVCAGVVGEWTYTVDYCAGAELFRIALLTRVVRTILEALPESITPEELEALLPGWSVRPVHKDEACFGELLRLAASATVQTGGQVA